MSPILSIFIGQVLYMFERLRCFMVSIGNAKQVVNLFMHTSGQSFVQKPDIVRVFVGDFRYVPQAASDIFVKSIRQISEIFIKADKKIFSWVKSKLPFSMTEVNPECLAEIL